MPDSTTMMMETKHDRSAAVTAIDRTIQFSSPRLPDAPTVTGYQIGRRLGAGAMGTVYLARRVSDGRQVAVKVLRDELRGNQRQVDRFLREARTVSGITHPSILPVLEHGISSGTPYLVMPYHAAGDLDQRIRMHGVLNEDELRRLARECASALAELARRGLLHRDLKPANILIADDGTAVLADFGIACSIQRGHPFLGTSEGGVAGTPNYISPEQAAGRVLDERSDLFGLGGILFAAATGRPPFLGPNGYDVVAQVLRDQAPSVATFRRGLSRDLVAIIDRCLQHRRESRYKDANALLAHLIAPGRRTSAWPLLFWTWIVHLVGHRPSPAVIERAPRQRPRPGWRVFYPAPLILTVTRHQMPEIETSELLALLRETPSSPAAASEKEAGQGRPGDPCQLRTHRARPGSTAPAEPMAEATRAANRPARADHLKRRFARRVHPPGRLAMMDGVRCRHRHS